MAEISMRDAKMMYQSSLVLRKGVPMFIRSVREDGYVHAWNLVSQKFTRFKFKQEDMSPPSVRLGYVNMGTNCFFINRIPSRVYKVGLSSENLKMKRTDHPLNDAEEKEAYSIMSSLSSVSLYKTIKGVYPKFKTACSEASQNNGCVAFDRQFAIDYKGVVYYKGNTVGTWNTEGIHFDKNYSHLVNNLPKDMQ